MIAKVLALILVFFVQSVWAKTPVGNPGSRRAKEHFLNLAREKQDEADHAREAVRYVQREPYVPQEYDYGIEMGAAWGEMSYYTVGGMLGYHAGTCLFSDSQRCQQYLDLIFNVNGRDAHTHYLGLGSLRWQWVNFPSPWSLLTRIMVGANNQIVPGSVDQYFTYAAGFGITTYLHPKADLRLEYRIYQSDVVYSQLFFGIQFKMEKWVEFFAEKLKDIGVGTAEVTGAVVEGTAEVTGEVVKGTADVVGGAAKGAAEATGLKKTPPPKQ